MSAQADHKKWCICQLHQSGFPDPPYYTKLPQYGPWDNERDARQVSDLLATVGKSGLWTSGSRMRRRSGVGFTNRFDHGDRRNFIVRPARHKEEIL